RCWEPMVKFIQWRLSESKDFLGVAHGNDWGDWLSLNEKTPLDYIDSAYFAGSTRLMEKIALALGKTNEVSQYRELFDSIKTAFNKKYVNPDGSLAVNTQTAYALALQMDLLPDHLRAVTGSKLAQRIDAYDSLMSTGFLGTRALLLALSSSGQHD